MRLFWWAPLRDPRALWAEGRTDACTWARVVAHGGLPFYNFGDALSPIVVRSLGLSVTWSRLDRANLTAIGSLLDLYKYVDSSPDALVWGSGLRGPQTEGERAVILAKVGRFLAVRGPMTRRGLGLPEGTPVGDPGILAPLAFDGRAPARSTAPAVLPHYRAWSSASSRSEIAALRALGFTVIQPNLSAEKVVQKIRACSRLYTSSLHGAIIADSFGIPAAMLSFSGPPLSGESEFKYRDYFESVGGEPLWLRPADIGQTSSSIDLEVLDHQAWMRHLQSVALRAPLAQALVSAY